MDHLTKTEKAFIIGTSPDQFRAGELAEIVGIKIITPQNKAPRICYHVRFFDAVEDYWPVNDDTYQIISPSSIKLDIQVKEFDDLKAIKKFESYIINSLPKN